MTQQANGILRSAGRTVLSAAFLIVMVAAPGCDSSVDVRTPVVPRFPDPQPGPSGPTTTESRAISGVEGVSLQAVGVVDIDLGATESLVITAPESVMPRLTSDVVGGLLILDSDPQGYEGQVSDIRYDLTLQRLDELFLRGVGQIRARGVDANHFRVELNGLGSVHAAGRVDRQDVTVAAVGDYFGAGLQSRIARVNITGGYAQMWATERIEGFVGFGCVLEYLGDPTIEVQGRGTVRRLD
jgi:hypothetical protein